jgi:2-phospho-L-lactate/phosphoenolpyruvate guanylyltransferase
VEQPIHMVIPFKNQGAKSRLACVLTPQERQLLSFAMLKDVLDAVLGFGWATILSQPGLDAAEVGYDVEIHESELDLNDALNAVIADEASRGWPSDILIVMADLALLTQNDVVGILNCQGDVVLCPGRGGGTNMILIRSPMFRTCYTGLSYPKHLAAARQAGMKASIYESFRAGCDIDVPDDLAEVLLHGRREAKALLTELGFSLSENARDSAGASPIIRRCAPPDSQRQF